MTQIPVTTGQGGSYSLVTTDGAVLQVEASNAVQAAWFVDAVNGNDLTGTGTQAAPLKTIAELANRVGDQWMQLSQRVDVYLVSHDYTAQQGAAFCVATASTAGLVFWHGTQTVLHQGVLSAATNANPANNQPYEITDAGGLAWTPYLGQYVKLTSGANVGAMAPILKDEGGGKARMGEFMVPSQSVLEPPIGLVLAGNESYEIVSLSMLPPLVVDVQGISNQSEKIADWAMQDCCLDSSSTFAGEGNGQLVTCQWDGTKGGVGLVKTGLWLEQNTTINGNAQIQYSGGIALLWGGAARYGGIALASPALFILDGNWVNQGNAQYILSGRGIFCNFADFDNGTWWVETGSTMHFSSTESSLGVGIYWGSNVATSVQIESFAWAVYDAAFQFKFATAKFTLGGAAAVPFMRADTGAYVAATNCTIANLLATYAGGGFNGNAIDMLQSGAGFVKFVGNI